MILIACVDDNLGMAFHRRRQSKDRLLRERILEQVGNAPLWMSPYSAKQFEEGAENICTDEDFLTRCSAQEYAFTELEAPGKVASQVGKLILYRWNRSYPADLYFDLELDGYTLAAVHEFAGSSHEKITEEIYIK